MVRSMTPDTDLPLLFWGLALETTTLLLNQVPSKTVVKHHMSYGLGNVLVLVIYEFGDVTHMLTHIN